MIEPMQTSDLHLATCSIRAFRPDMGIPVRTTVGLIRAIKTESGSKLAPYGIFGKVPDDDWPQFHRLYVERLDGLAAQIDAQLLDLQGKYPGQTLVLLCFDDVRKDRCHREIAAKWLAERYGNNVPELGPHDERDHVGPLRSGEPAFRPDEVRLF